MRSAEQYIGAIDEAIKLSNANEPAMVSDFLIQKPGMSSRKGRLFLNNFFKILGNSTNYLEIGCWMGSTFFSALFDNPGISGFGIDNFSQFHQGSDQPFNVREILAENLKLIPHGKFFDSDCWQFDKSQLPIIDVYFYDGAHDERSQYRAWMEYDQVLADTFVAIVDDWEFKPNIYDVQLGTMRAFKELRYDIIRCWFLQRTDHWHEGMFVAVVNRRPK